MVSVVSASAAAAVEVCIRVEQQRGSVAVVRQAIQMVPGIAIVTLDPLHGVLLREATARRCARFDALRDPSVFVVIFRGG